MPAHLVTIVAGPRDGWSFSGAPRETVPVTLFQIFQLFQLIQVRARLGLVLGALLHHEGAVQEGVRVVEHISLPAGDIG